MLAVLTFHVCLVTGAIDRPVVGDAASVLGRQGPILFFVISGFLLYRPFVAACAAAAKAPSAARYARRRILRIVPAYWVALTVLAIFPGIPGVFSDDWWRYYFFLQLYSRETLGLGIPVAWTLCVEVSFYVLLPVWAAMMRRLRIGPKGGDWLRTELVALAVVALGGALVQLAAARNVVSDVVGSTLLGQCTWLALGMALAVASVAADRGRLDARVVRFVTDHAGLCWLGAAGAFAGLAALVPRGGLPGLVLALVAVQPVATVLATIVLQLCLNVLVVAPAIFGERAGGVPRRILALSPLAWLGLVSYGVYLWHLTIVEWLAFPADPRGFSTGLGLASRIDHFVTPILFVLALALSAAVAAASYYVIELPFLRRKER